MAKNQGRFRKYLTDRNISLVIRWWAAGAIYFFIGWGTFLGNQETIIDFVFSLGLVMGLFSILIINPVLRLMFNIGTKRPTHENTFWQRISDHLVELIKNIFIVFVIALIYQGINKALILGFRLPADAVPLPGEPILFGVFYLFVFLFIDVIIRKIKETIFNFQGGKEK